MLLRICISALSQSTVLRKCRRKHGTAISGLKIRHLHFCSSQLDPDLISWDPKLLIHLANVELPNVELPNVELPNAELSNVELPNAESYPTSNITQRRILQNVLQNIYRTGSRILQNVLQNIYRTGSRILQNVPQRILKNVGFKGNVQISGNA